MTIKYRNGILIVSCPPQSSHLLKIFLPICFIIITGCYLFTSQTQILLNSTSGSGSLSGQVGHIYEIAVSGEKGSFVKKVLDNDIDGPFDNRWLSTLCSSRVWLPGLIFQCEAPQGGVGNVRNVFLNCIRYAIEAGASSFIVPEIVERGDQLTEITTENVVPFSYFFDLDYFTTTLSEACPQMTIISHINDLWDMPTTANPIPIPEIVENFLPESPKVMADPSEWLPGFQKFLKENAPNFSASKPVVINVGTPLLQFPLSYDDPRFVATFGKILRFREDTRRLAATVLYALNSKFNLRIDPSSPGIPSKKFYGAHLRTAVDAAISGWTPYEVQSQNYLDGAMTSDLSVIYLTSGNPTDTGRFSEEATSLSLNVTTKTELLSAKDFSEDLAAMERLTWDQQALIDWEVLLRSSMFGSTWESSFGWNIALRRHIVVGGGTWVGHGEDIPKILTSLSPDLPLPTAAGMSTLAPPAGYTPVVAADITTPPPTGYTPIMASADTTTPPPFEFTPISNVIGTFYPPSVVSTGEPSAEPTGEPSTEPEEGTSVEPEEETSVEPEEETSVEPEEETSVEPEDEHSGVPTKVANPLLPPADYTPNTESFLPLPTPTAEPQPKMKNPWMGERRRLHRRVMERNSAEQSFQDDASVIFGAPGQGNYFELSMWP